MRSSFCVTEVPQESRGEFKTSDPFLFDDKHASSANESFILSLNT